MSDVHTRGYEGPERRNGGNGMRRSVDHPPWFRIAGLVVTMVGLSTGPLWMAYFQLNQLLTDPKARPEAYTNTMARNDKRELRREIEKSRNTAIELAVARLKTEMPPPDWRNRIRALEAFARRHEKDFPVPNE